MLTMHVQYVKKQAASVKHLSILQLHVSCTAVADQYNIIAESINSNKSFNTCNSILTTTKKRFLPIIIYNVYKISQSCNRNGYTIKQ